jgi:hypothetical protein
MSERQPSKVKNLDIYGNAPLEWKRVRDLLATVGSQHVTFFLGTVGKDGQPHSAGVGAAYLDGVIYVVSGPRTRKSRNLAGNPRCTLAVALHGVDVVLEGEAKRVTDARTLERVAAHYRTNGWPAEVKGDAFTAPYSAPSAGPAPWYLYRFVFDKAVGVAGEEPHGATRWRF